MVAAVGRFGPFIRHDGKFVSIPKDLNPLTITAEEAIALIEGKRVKDEQRFIKKFEEDPEMEILKGRSVLIFLIRKRTIVFRKR